MLEFVIDNIFAMFGGRVFQQTVGIPMSVNCVPLPTNMFLSPYDSDFTQGLFNKSEKKLKFDDFVDSIYSIYSIPVKNETLQRKRRFQFTHFYLSNYM